MRIVSSLFFLTMATSSAPVKLLIFGGNGFIGSHVSERLLDSGHHLTLISSKGSFSFDAVTKVRPRIARQFRCDRYNPSYCDKDLWPLLDEADSNFDAIIDFSAYRLETVQPFYERLAKSSGIDQKRPLYIYISTDSVYEVSKRFDEDRLLKETDSVRPEDEEERSRLAKGDSYGHRKLEIEEFLIDRRRNHGGLPYTILRLPDVLGKRILVLSSHTSNIFRGLSRRTRFDRSFLEISTMASIWPVRQAPYPSANIRSISVNQLRRCQGCWSCSRINIKPAAEIRRSDLQHRISSADHPSRSSEGNENAQ